MAALGGMHPHIGSHPFIQITEQPKQRGMRFRYECEGRSAGSIPGENTTAERKTWPAIQVRNYVGKVNIRVSLVTKDTPPRSHPHSLVGKDCEGGICQVEVTPDSQMGACFSNLGIQCVKRREVQDALQERRRQGVDPFNTYRDADEHPSVDIDLAIVRLCFEGFILQNNQYIKLKPVVSNPIFDKKSTPSSLLRICRVDKSFGNCKGGDEVYLLCDKVQKDDISVCFYEKGGWEAFGEFSPTDVHRQVAIVFRTPPYKDSNLRHPVTVFFQLKRISDGQTSESKEFTYLSQDHGQPSTSTKRTYPFDGQSKEIVREAISKKFSKGSTMRVPEVPLRQPLFPNYNPNLAMAPPPSVSQPQYSLATDPQPELSEDILNKVLGDLSPFPLEDFKPTLPQLPSGLPPPYTTASSSWIPDSLQGGVDHTSFSNFPNSSPNIARPVTPFFSPPSNYNESLLPNVDSISSLRNASFGNIDTDDILENDMKNLSIENIKQERRDYSDVSNMQATHFIAPPYPIESPALNQTSYSQMQSSVMQLSPDNFSNSGRQQANTPLQAAPNLLASTYTDDVVHLPSFDLNESYSVDVIDDLVQATTTGGGQNNLP